MPKHRKPHEDSDDVTDIIAVEVPLPEEPLPEEEWRPPPGISIVTPQEYIDRTYQRRVAREPMFEDVQPAQPEPRRPPVATLVTVAAAAAALTLAMVGLLMAMTHRQVCPNPLPPLEPAPYTITVTAPATP